MPQALDFLQNLFQQGIGYSAINTARSALSCCLPLYDGVTFGNHPRVKLFLKGIYNLRPTVPRYTSIWDAGIVVAFLKSWSPAKRLPLNRLAPKLAMLILLVSGQRPQVLPVLSTRAMDISATSVRFALDHSDLKQSRPGYKPELIVLKKYPADKRVCVYHYLTTYLHRTLDLRGSESNLFITVKKPYRRVTLSTVSRWLKTVLSEAGIDLSVFGPGSTRAASTSKARKAGVPVDEVLRKGGWARSSTFTKFYEKPIRKEDTFAAAVLGQ